jgi:hypothetical protein
LAPKRILYILSGNLSTTPRALQSIREACKHYDVNILGINRSSQWKAFDDELVQEHSFNYSALSLGSDKLIVWLVVGFLHKVCIFLYLFFKQSITITAFASTKVHILLWVRLKNERDKYDLIIGHSGSSLYPVWRYAQRHHIPFIFDVEDYHPGEKINKDAKNEKQRREFLLQKLLPDAADVIMGSPLIGERITKLLGKLSHKNSIVINNCFPSDEFEFKKLRVKSQEPGNIRHEPSSSSPHAPDSVFYASHVTPLKVHFVWFSQNISANRGLELMIPELAKLKESVHLHLIGNLYTDFDNQWILPNHEFISTYSPMSQKELNHFICQFDVGLALELGSADENRQICLTNKIWAYLQAGLFILATDTLAQVKFMKEHEKHGIAVKVVETSYSSGTEELRKQSIDSSLKNIVTNIDRIRTEKKDRFEKARAFSWEVESKKLRRLWDSVLSD